MPGNDIVTTERGHENPDNYCLEVCHQVQEVGLRRGDHRAAMRCLLLIIERQRRFLIEVPGQSADDDVDVTIEIGVRLEPIPASDEAERESRLVVQQLEWFDKS